MSPRTKNNPKLTIPNRNSPGQQPRLQDSSTALENMDPFSSIGHNADQLDKFSFSPRIHDSGFQGLQAPWSINNTMLNCSGLSPTSECTTESLDGQAFSATDFDAQESQMFNFPSYSRSGYSEPAILSSSMEQPAYTTCIASSHNVTASCNSPQLAFGNTEGFQNMSTLMGCPMGTESTNGGNSTSTQTAHSPNHQDYCDVVSTSNPWGQSGLNNSSTGKVVHMANLYLPATPSLSEASQTVASPASFRPYTGLDGSPYMVIDEPYLSTPNFTLGEPLYPVSPALSAQDPMRTIRLSKPRASSSSEAIAHLSDNAESDMFSTVDMDERTGDDLDTRNPRDHPFYSLPPDTDGNKYLDSHLKPYRCKIAQCVDAHFSSNACLFRHEREAHGMHGHGDNPHLCHFPSCERSLPGNGFPRRWNLHDHMKRVHDYTSSEKASSPERSPVTVQPGKKKTPAVRKRKGAASNTQTIKRSRANQTQASTALKLAQVRTGQQLQNASRSYLDCLARVLEDLKDISPRDAMRHDRANAHLQELITLSLNYRFIEAGQIANERAAKMP
ncbi:hypothetical protein FQN57_007309 [Myotisia sp. PD_48]|nr:hypothetical protein FQN57_007309 [Myotisia sp. PD_48]